MQILKMGKSEKKHIRFCERLNSVQGCILNNCYRINFFIESFAVVKISFVESFAVVEISFTKKIYIFLYFM